MTVKITILAMLMIMAAYFLVLYGRVGLIQDKRFFSSAPKENLAAIPDRKERFRGAHMMRTASCLAMCGNIPKRAFQRTFLTLIFLTKCPLQRRRFIAELLD